jgi:hypothetical protein
MTPPHENLKFAEMLD